MPVRRKHMCCLVNILTASKMKYHTVTVTCYDIRKKNPLHGCHMTGKGKCFLPDPPEKRRISRMQQVIVK